MHSIPTVPDHPGFAFKYLCCPSQTSKNFFVRSHLESQQDCRSHTGSLSHSIQKNVSHLSKSKTFSASSSKSKTSLFLRMDIKKLISSQTSQQSLSLVSSAMGFWFVLLLSLCISVAFKFFILKPQKNPRTLPPGPSAIPIIGLLFWVGKSFSDIELILRQLSIKYGPIITVYLGFRPAIFISTHALAHQTLIQNGAIFADRPPASATNQIITSNQHNINSAGYGPLWRFLRRNLTSEIFHPSRVKSYAHARKWVLDILINRLRSQVVDSGEPLCVVDDFRYAMFCLLALMCFGEKLDEKTIRRIEDAQRSLLLRLDSFTILNILPRLTKILFRKSWRELKQLRQNQEHVLIPLVRAREENKKPKREEVADSVLCYVDTLLDLQLPDENRNLNDQEMVSLCSEFLNAGTDTTSTALQWIMANLVKHQHVQTKLFEEIQRVTKEGEEIKEEDLQNMHYLKAVVLEGLRMHPPAHFVLPHAVTEDFMLDGYVIPKNGSVNFMVAEMGRDPKVWEDPMEFKPERFLSGEEVFDITGSREIKMMPFGAGRRICPGYGLALLHLEYFLANLVKEFEWKPVDGDDVDLTEKDEFTTVMKNPLRVHLCARVK